ncbi:MAG: L-lactate dehydrogenase [Calditrichia bacterium]
MKIGIVGTGLVGATAAYALVMRGVGRQIVMVDLNRQRAEAEANDILHAVPFANPLEVYAGDYADLAGSRVVIVAAGVNQKPGETRLQLLNRNTEVFFQVIPEILKYAPDAILIIATNPVDIMTHVSAHIAAREGLPKNRVMGSGTTLDTARFRTLIGRHIGVDAMHVHAYVVGEHGDSEVLTWSLVTVGGVPLAEYSRMNQIVLNNRVREQIDEQVRRAAYHIIEGKGATYYGIGSALARIVNAVIYDQRAILTVCAPHEEVAGVENVTLSLPHLVGGQGVMSSLPLPLAGNEETALRHSAKILREHIDMIERLK